MTDLLSEVSTTSVTTSFTLKTQLLEPGQEQLYSSIKCSDFTFFPSAEEIPPSPCSSIRSRE